MDQQTLKEWQRPRRTQRDEVIDFCCWLGTAGLILATLLNEMGVF